MVVFPFKNGAIIDEVLCVWLPQSGDTLEWNDKIYTVRKFGSGVFYQDTGNYEIVMRIFVTVYRG